VEQTAGQAKTSSWQAAKEPGMTKHLERVVLPTPLPFDGVDFYQIVPKYQHASAAVLVVVVEPVVVVKLNLRCEGWCG
jgi:hypothetical protein